MKSTKRKSRLRDFSFWLRMLDFHCPPQSHRSFLRLDASLTLALKTPCKIHEKNRKKYLTRQIGCVIMCRSTNRLRAWLAIHRVFVCETSTSYLGGIAQLVRVLA